MQKNNKKDFFNYWFFFSSTEDQTQGLAHKDKYSTT